MRVRRNALAAYPKLRHFGRRRSYLSRTSASRLGQRLPVPTSSEGDSDKQDNRATREPMQLAPLSLDDRQIGLGRLQEPILAAS